MSGWMYVGIGVAVGVVLLPLLVWLGFKILVLVLKKKFGDLAKGIAGMMPPPLRVHLKPLKEEPDWLKSKDAQAADAGLRALGFETAGDFEVDEMYEVSIRAYGGPDQQSAAYLFKHPAKDRPVLDMIKLFGDGTSLCLSNGEDDGMEQCPAHQNIKLTGAEPARLWDELQSRAGDTPTVPIPRDELAQTYEKGYAQVMDWRVEKGGVSEAEMLAHTDSSMGEETLVEARKQFREQNLSQLQDLLGIRYREQSRLPVQRWEEVRDRLLYVHDRFTPEELHEVVCEEHLHWLEPQPERPKKPGREGFRELLEGLGENHGVEHLATVEGTIPADVYVFPDPPEDDDC